MKVALNWVAEDITGPYNFEKKKYFEIFAQNCLVMEKYNFEWFLRWQKAEEPCFLININHDKKRFLMILSSSFNYRI